MSTPSVIANDMPADGRPAFRCHQIHLVVLKHAAEVTLPGRRFRKAVFLSRRFVETDHRVEFAKIDCDNVHDLSLVWGGMNVACESTTTG